VVIPNLIALLYDMDRDVRVSAAEALGNVAASGWLQAEKAPEKEDVHQEQEQVIHEQEPTVEEREIQEIEDQEPVDTVLS
jgi:hypothetical protein